VLGEFARSSVLGGQRASSAKLTGAGFTFTHTRLDQALRTALARR
jgi:NAD dependent epimerase/dehydratase family enzyme